MSASAGLLCRLFPAVTYLTIDEMQMIAKKLLIHTIAGLSETKGASGAFDYPDLKGSLI